VAAGFALVWVNYSRLPERVPIHFGLDGKPDGWGVRSWIWLLPVVGLLAWALCAVPVLAGPAPSNMKLFLAVERLLLAGLYSTLTRDQISVATGAAQRLSGRTWGILGLTMLSPLLLFVWK